ncbi:MAG: hypothetical protein AAF926_00320 [Pseudomonadota bacterium]
MKYLPDIPGFDDVKSMQRALVFAMEQVTADEAEDLTDAGPFAAIMKNATDTMDDALALLADADKVRKMEAA